MGWALLVGTGLMVLGVIFFAISAAITLRVLSILHLRVSDVEGFWKTVAVLIVTALVVSATHVFQVGLWAGTLLAFGEADGLRDAIYRSAANYATLGGADAAPSDHWRLLGPLEAVNGVVLLGLSSALMFTVMTRLAERRNQKSIVPMAPSKKDTARLS
jgi:hypothetical protein